MTTKYLERNHNNTYFKIISNVGALRRIQRNIALVQLININIVKTKRICLKKLTHKNSLFQHNIL